MKAFTLVLVAMLLLVIGCTQQPVIEQLSPEDFSELASSNEVFVLDTHIPEQEHIAGTDAFIPYNQLRENADQLPADTDTPIAVYCRSGSMSAEAAQTLQEMGYSNVYDLQGGANAWRAAGLPFLQGGVQ